MTMGGVLSFPRRIESKRVKSMEFGRMTVNRGGGAGAGGVEFGGVEARVVGDGDVRS